MRLAIVTALIATTSLLPGQKKAAVLDNQWGDNGQRENEIGLFSTRPRGAPLDIPAIKHGLEWLTDNQQPDGHWPCEHSKDASVAVTSLCLLAVLGNGSTMRRGPHKNQIKRAASWLRTQQKESGAFADGTGPHLLATLAMMESYCLSDYKLLRKTAAKGFQYAAALRSADGGWRASPEEESSDPSLTVWGTMMLATASEANVAAKNESYTGVFDWLRSTKANLAPHSGVLGVAVPMVRQAELAYDQSAANGFTLCWLALTPSNPTELATMQADAAIIREHALARARALPRIWKQNPRYKLSINEWFLSSHALAQAGDKKAVEKITEALTKQQSTDGDDKGSWQPIGVWGEAGGRTWTTAMAVLTLEAPFRYAKIVGR
jgi:hypothetical protein